MAADKKKQKKRQKTALTSLAEIVCLCVICFVLVYIVSVYGPFSVQYNAVSPTPKTVSAAHTATSAPAVAIPAPLPTLDTALYNKDIEALANNIVLSTTTGTSTLYYSAPSPWPPKTVYPEAGALLPFNRIVAYYGNFYSKSLGILGQYPPQEMLQMLASTSAEWQAADPGTPVIPALDYIAVTAQDTPGPDGLYNLRMPPDQIEEAITLANQIHGIVFLDVQIGQSTVEREVPLLAAYLKLPNVELALDPEFSMPAGKVPGTVIGTMDASDINYAAHFLADIVDENHLPPKILVVHRFTEDMVTDSEDITPLPEVQVVMDMDGWGSQSRKIKVYRQVIYDYPVQFAGIKLFYKNDLLPPSTGLLTPAQVLDLRPKPIYIQYQ